MSCNDSAARGLVLHPTARGDCRGSERISAFVKGIAEPSFNAAARLQPPTAARGAERLNRSTVKPVPRADSAVAVDSFFEGPLGQGPPRLSVHQ
jgi:hypothetical protein